MFLFLDTENDLTTDKEDLEVAKEDSYINVNEELKDFIHNVIVINASVDICSLSKYF